jgi:hypothetical protein
LPFWELALGWVSLCSLSRPNLIRWSIFLPRISKSFHLALSPNFVLRF